MKRPLSLFALTSLALCLSVSSVFAASEDIAVSNGQSASASAYADIERLLPGVWNADNCNICKLNVINMGGFLYGDMTDWGSYGRSYSGGYQPIDIVSNDTFFYRGDYFQFYYLGGTGYRIENISNGGDRNVAGATRYGYYPAPIPPRPIPRPVPRPLPPRPRPRPVPHPVPHPVPAPHPVPVPHPVPAPHPQPAPHPVPPPHPAPAPRPHGHG
ncbi:MAG: hypothetical protein JST04_17300 [Bdellovibrionales bacterium]|nr:hypothetical protein [Bdellovibrionales bacterium]